LSAILTPVDGKAGERVVGRTLDTSVDSMVVVEGTVQGDTLTVHVHTREITTRRYQVRTRITSKNPEHNGGVAILGGMCLVLGGALLPTGIALTAEGTEAYGFIATGAVCLPLGFVAAGLAKPKFVSEVRTSQEDGGSSTKDIPLAGREIRVVFPNGQGLQGWTDRDGNFAIDLPEVIGGAPDPDSMRAAFMVGNRAIAVDVLGSELPAGRYPMSIWDGERAELEQVASRWRPEPPSLSFALAGALREVDDHTDDDVRSAIVPTRVDNLGAGPAHRVRVSFCDEQAEHPGVRFVLPWEIGDLQPGQSQPLDISVQIIEDELVSETETILLCATDQDGNIAPQVELALATGMETEPPLLSLSLDFEDSSSMQSDRALNALEQAEIVATIRNRGRGSARGVRLQLMEPQSAERRKAGYSCELPVVVGDVEPGGERTVHVPLVASQRLVEDDAASVAVIATEERGYDAPPAEIQFATRALLEPQLAIASIEVRDGRQGEADGDGDGVLENGERAEVDVVVSNEGEGAAYGVATALACANSGVRILRSEDEISRLPQGATAHTTFVVEVPHTYDGDRVTVEVTARDGRGASVGQVRRVDDLAFTRRVALLEIASVEVIDKATGRTRGDGDGVLENGERAELRVALRNNGSLAVDGVRAMVTGATDLLLGNPEIFFGAVAPASTSHASLLVDVPRGETREQIPLHLDLWDVDGAVHTGLDLSTTVVRRTPELGLELRDVYDGCIDPESAGDCDHVVDLNEKVVLRFALVNSGEITAEDVTVGFSSTGVEYVDILDQDPRPLTVEARSSTPIYVDLQMLVRGRFRGDSVPLKVEITQRDFDGLRFVERVAIGGAAVAVRRTAPEEGLDQFQVIADRGVYDGGISAARSEPIVWPDIDEPLISKQTAPADHAVVVGIDDYLAISDVEYAREDALAFADFLERTRGIPGDQIEILLGQNVTNEQILEAVTGAGQRSAGDGTVWFYFAGHGAASVETHERLLLGPEARGDPKTMERRSVRVEEVYELASVNGANVVALLDVCFSGKGRDGEQLIEGGRAFVPVYEPRDEAGMLEWSATEHDEIAWKYDTVGHGAFTYFAIGALRGWADGAVDGVRDGEVTAEEAQRYVERVLARLPLTSVQHPVMSGVETGSWVLSSGDRLETDPLTRTSD